MKTEDSWRRELMIFMLMVACMVMFFWVPASAVRDNNEKWRQDAISHGHAEWELDRFGEKQWRWRDLGRYQK